MTLRSHAPKKQQSSSDTSIQNQFQPRPFVDPLRPEPPQNEQVDLRAKLDTASRFGFSYTKMVLAGHGNSDRASIQPVRPVLQRKLTIGAPGDKYEQEADRVAAQVVSQINAPKPEPQSAHNQRVQRADLPEEEEPQMKLNAEKIQRMELPEDDEELQMKSIVPRSLDGAMDASADLEGAIAQARGSGQPLNDTIRQPMEQAFGADFSGVKVHTDSQSDQLNRSVQAKAFTTGQDIFFRQGAYQPGSQGGQELLAHELTHVIQQNGGNSNQGRLQRSEGNRSSAVIDDTVFSGITPITAAPATIQRVIHERYKRIWAYAGANNYMSNDEIIALQNMVGPLKGKQDAVVKDVISLSNFITQALKDRNRKRKIQILLWKDLLKTNLDIASAKALKKNLEKAKNTVLNQLLNATDTSGEEEEKSTKIYIDSDSSSDENESLEEKQPKNKGEVSNPLKAMSDVYYSGDAPLNEADGQAIMSRLTKRDKGVIGVIKKLHTEGGAQQIPMQPNLYFETEWGLGQIKNTTEMVLILGAPTGVDWKNYLKYVIPLAHAHPSGSKRRINEREDGGIAESGFIPFNLLCSPKGGQKRLTVFPSTRDISFCAEQGIKKHTVFTPYFCAYKEIEEQYYIFDTDIPFGNKIGRLEFDILNARKDPNDNDIYYCTLQVRQDADVIWEQDDVLANEHNGGHSTLILKDESSYIEPTD